MSPAPTAKQGPGADRRLVAGSRSPEEATGAVPHSTTGSIAVSFLTAMPSPYTQDLFRVMASDGRIRPQVFYLEMTAPDTYWGTVPLPDYAKVLPGFWFSLLGGRIHVNPGAIEQIAASKPDAVVIGGYSGWTNQTAMRWLHRRNIPWVFWGEIPGMTHRHGLGAVLRWLAQRPAVRWPNGIAAIGSRAVQTYGRLNRGRCPVANIPYCCDMQPFLAIRRDESCRAGRVRFLYCGQLIHRKGLDLLLDAFCQTATTFRHIELVLVGEGPLRSDLESRVPEAIRERVQFAGFRPVDELPDVFAKADVFVLPSRHDGWGVVVNQAIAAGMPVICSDAVGAADDLVTENENGHIFAAGNGRQLADAIASFAANPEKIGPLGRCSRQRAADWSPERGVDRWYQLLHEILGHANSSRYRVD